MYVASKPPKGWLKNAVSKTTIICDNFETDEIGCQSVYAYGLSIGKDLGDLE